MVGIENGVPFPAVVYRIIGLVLQPKLVVPQPKNPLSQVSRQVSPQQLAFCCKRHITAKISDMHEVLFVSLLLHIYNPPLYLYSL